MKFPFPDETTTALDAEFVDLSDIVTGPVIYVSIDGNIFHYTFYRDENLVAGQYVSAVNIEDPSKRVGPWEIPPELINTGKNSVQAVYTLFITDEKTRAALGAKE